MKTSFLLVPLITACLTLGLLSSCEKKSLPAVPFEKELALSKQIWLQFKNDCNDTYKYKIYEETYTNIDGEHTVSTVITVKEGIIIRREYIDESCQVDHPHDGESCVITQVIEWTENRDDLNTHPEGTKAMTMDNVYTKARNEWLKKMNGNFNYILATDNDGMISKCGNYNLDIFDGERFNGITILEIESWIP